MATAIIKGEGADALKRMTMMTTSRPVPPAPLPPTPHTHLAHCRGQPLNWRCHNFWFPTNLTIQLTRSDDSSQVISQNNSLIIPRASLRAQAVKNLPANAEDSGLIPGSGRSLEKETATHSSIFAWEIPWTEEPGGLQSMGLQRVRHDFTTEQQHHSIAQPQGW